MILTGTNKVERDLDAIGEIAHLMCASSRDENSLTLWLIISLPPSDNEGVLTHRILIHSPADDTMLSQELLSQA